MVRLRQPRASEEDSEVSDIYDPGTSEVIHFGQSELNDLVRDVHLPMYPHVLHLRLEKKVVFT